MSKQKRVIGLLLAVLLIFLLTLTACNKEIKDGTFVVTFKDYDGSVISECVVKEGENVVPPNVPIRKGYEFFGWNKDLTQIDKETTVIAMYSIPKNQLFFDYKANDYKLVVTLSLCGNVEVCGLEAVLSYSANSLVLETIEVGQNENVSEINYVEQTSGIKFFFFHDQIENITEQFDILILTFDGLTIDTELEFNLDVTVFVDKYFQPVTFNIANDIYQK